MTYFFGGGGGGDGEGTKRLAEKSFIAADQHRFLGRWFEIGGFCREQTILYVCTIHTYVHTYRMKIPHMLVYSIVCKKKRHHVVLEKEKEKKRKKKKTPDERKNNSSKGGEGGGLNLSSIGMIDMMTCFVMYLYAF